MAGHLTRSSLHRCLQRHGISRLPKAVEELWKAKPDIFIVKPNHHMLGLNT